MDGSKRDRENTYTRGLECLGGEGGSEEHEEVEVVDVWKREGGGGREGQHEFSFVIKSLIDDVQ